MSVSQEGLESKASALSLSSESPRSCRTKCLVCRNFYTNPKLLPCLHTFCLECLSGLEQFSVPQTGREVRSGCEGSLVCSDSRVCILCPACDCEVYVPTAGVQGLTTNYLIQNEVLLESLKRLDHKLVCDLCNDGDAERRCHVCSANLCDFCSKAHRRQRATASHNTVALKDLQSGTGRIVQPIMCCAHPSEELRLFCETCDCLVCRDCCLVGHHDHNCDFIANVINKHGNSIKQLLKQTQPRIGALQEIMQKIHSSRQILKEQLGKITEEINSFTEDYIRALEKHRNRLLKELEELRVQKENSLNLQQIQLEQILADVKTGVDFTDSLLTNGSHGEILLTKCVVVNRLKQLNKISYSTPPGEDDWFWFQSQERAGQCDGFEVFGIIAIKTVDPTKCILQGEGLQVAQQDQPSAFILVCNDQSGKQMGRGSESVRVSIFNKNKKECIKTTLQDNHDGTYRITYTPRTSGSYVAWVCVNGQHVQGSPFTITVESRFREHVGIFHCCTFCSSGGQKDVRCGCKGTMPGGFQGCGHGHKTHPGQPHWSCCGNLSKNSECSAALNGSLYQNLVRTVAL
ncbi:tripartite motif-containing protein 45 [Pristis pectinata]|uniref:tripartite motif-containing protein 45 n=1 Tax=Pristis pectinata TaxID=685728 RepID=UPI00223E125D|nr:tripartite motif-containing protein 45 [Pristis pectinata]